MSNLRSEINDYIKTLSHEERGRYESMLKENPSAVFEMVKQGDAVGIAIAIHNEVDMSQQNEDGKTPLHLAAEHDTKMIAELLIEDVNQSPWVRDIDGRLPLDVAREQGHHEIGDEIERVTYPEQFKELVQDDELIDRYIEASQSVRGRHTEPSYLQYLREQKERER